MKIRRKRPEIVKTQTVAAAIRRKEWICLIIALLFAFPSSGNAQCEAKNDAFKSGEHVMYELKKQKPDEDKKKKTRDSQNANRSRRN